MELSLLRTGSYRAWLEGLAEALGEMGYLVLLPHRDVSHWGETAQPLAGVAANCIEQVLASSSVVALAGRSYGSHVEVGVALGAGIPVVVVSASDAPLSEFAAALCESDLVTEVRFDTICPGVADPLRATLVAEAVARVLPSSARQHSKLHSMLPSVAHHGVWDDVEVSSASSIGPPLRQ